MDKWEELVWWLEGQIEGAKSDQKMYRENRDLWKGSEALIRGSINRQNAFELTLAKVKRLEESLP